MNGRCVWSQMSRQHSHTHTWVLLAILLFWIYPRLTKTEPWDNWSQCLQALKVTDMQRFLVVKLNCSSSVIIKSIWILRTSKNKQILEESLWQCAPDDLFTFCKWRRHTRKQTTKETVKCSLLTTDRVTTHRHNDKRKNKFLKHKWVK